MAEKPILFNTKMVRAILEGRKTQTRRVMKYSDCIPKGFDYPVVMEELGLVQFTDKPGDDDYMNWWPGYDDCYKCPYGKPGDILWVRETWCDPTPDNSMCPVLYKADMPMSWNARETEHGKAVTLKAENYKWRPSIHMPRAAARIFLEVQSIRVERLQDINTSDIQAEGLTASLMQDPCDMADQLFDKFKILWNSLYAKRGYPWESNPWVWVMEFEKLKGGSSGE